MDGGNAPQERSCRNHQTHSQELRTRVQYRGKVASPDLQRFAGTVFNIHHADVAVLVTTGTVTTPADRLAKAAGIEIVHADRLDRWADGRDQPPWHHSRTPLPPEGGP